MRHENKFKIGDRVRAIHTSGGNGVRAGDVFVVTKSEDGYLSFFNHRVGRYDGWGANYFEPTITIEPGKHYRTRSGKPTGRVTVGDTGFEAVVDGKVRIYDAAGGAVHGDDDIVEAWVPKVGERVRRFKGHNPGSLVGHEAVVQAIEDISPDPEGPWLKFEDGTTGYAANFEPLPVAPQLAAPALKIEACRYYKTRDGRRVGPLVTTDNNEYWPFKWPKQTMYYKADGYSCPGAAHRHRDQDDLVAEWQETTNVGAQVDTLAEEYGSPHPSNDNAAKPKFKKGDRIKLAAVHEMAGYGRLDGETGTVLEDSSVPYVKWDRDGAKLAILEKEADLIATTPTVTTSTIVALIENGQPKPSVIPHVHASEAAATTEAKRLAGIHKGKRFGVFVLTTTAEEAAPTYRHEWQRLAVAGRKIDAIRELRGLTGMQLKPAKDVVEHFTAYPYGQAA